MKTGYNQEAPTEDAALQSFVRVLGTEQAQTVWNRACVSLGITRPGPPLSLQQLRSVAERLADEQGFVGVMGTALRIRLDTYEKLHQSSSWLQGPASGLPPSTTDESSDAREP